MIDPDALAAELAAMQAARLRRIAARQQAAAEHADTSPAGYSRGGVPPVTPGGHRCPGCRRHLPADAYDTDDQGRPGQWCAACLRQSDHDAAAAELPTDRVPPALWDLDAQHLDDAAAVIAAHAATSTGPLAHAWATLAHDLQAAADHLRPRPATRDQHSPPPDVFV